jgi:hypothetical protein
VQQDRDHHSGITSAVRLELWLRGPSVYGFSFNGWSTTRESSFGFSARSASRPKTCMHISRQFGDTSYIQRSAWRWCRSVRQGHEHLYEEVRSRRLRIDFLNIRILTLPDEQPFHSAYLIAETPGISHSTLLSYLRESLGLKIFHLRWIPHALTTSSQQIRMETCRALLPILKVRAKNEFQRYVTGDGSWLTLGFRHSTKWSASRDDVP